MLFEYCDKGVLGVSSFCSVLAGMLGSVDVCVQAYGV
jgi:hypothetical protein